MSPISPRLTQAAPARRALAPALLRTGAVGPDALIDALSREARAEARMADVLLAQGRIDPARLAGVQARLWGVGAVDLAAELPDPRLIDALGAADCLRLGLVPWRRAGAATVVATSRPDEFLRHRPRLEAALGPVSMVVAPVVAVEGAVRALRGAQLARAAETRVAEAESCRSLTARRMTRAAVAAAVVALWALWLVPQAVVAALVGVAVLALVASMALRLAALIATLRPAAAEGPAPLIARPPVVSILVALYREADIAPRLVARLARLDWPADLLDVLIVVEEGDGTTRAALARTALPPWMRVIVVPPGAVKTKPRALNYALDHCRGSIVGVYDAEDAPEPDQIARVVDRFHRRGPEVACLQGRLDFYNPRTNWIARAFTLDYAAWFRVILPGLDRLGLPIPLGGTTVFFRKAALERLGGWDAHNVTEDADLGMRLCRHGYRTEIIETTTMEEANCRAIPWVKQRSRWIKGYMMTWLVHMRDPARLWRELGPWKFAGFQVLVLGSLLQVLLAPVLWTFWLATLGLPHPVMQALPVVAGWALVGLFLAAEVLGLSVAAVGWHRRGRGFGVASVLLLPAYFAMGTAAAYKALWELIRNPFYWDKTSHGHFDHGPRFLRPRRR
jgi:cellulose synthase/poly-beta-1,6-N-acetylglucosamine synthase-like glycosyltransferase